MVANGRPRLTAAQVVLLAAYDLDQTQQYFSEFSLTVATWKRDNERFGLKGWRDTYPDHKRVSCEIMGRSKAGNPVVLGYIEKVKPNVYRLTDKGREAAKAILEAQKVSA